MRQLGAKLAGVAPVRQVHDVLGAEVAPGVMTLGEEVSGRDTIFHSDVARWACRRSVTLGVADGGGGWGSVPMGMPSSSMGVTMEARIRGVWGSTLKIFRLIEQGPNGLVRQGT